jgi:long-chain acyl-CoA synthetase
VHVGLVGQLRAQTSPDAPCIEDERIRLTSGEFAAAVEQLSGGLASLGLGAGDVVATMLPNCVEMVLTLFAAWRMGVAVTPVNPVLTAGEALYQLEDSGAKVVIADVAAAGKLSGADLRIVPVEDVSSLDGPVPPPRAEAGDLALLVYTSGTTGRPKGVMLDHANLAAMTEQIITALEIGATTRVLLVLPLFHVNGIMASVVSPLAAGGSTFILSRFDAKTFWQQVEKHRPTYFSAVPTIYLVLNSLPPEVKPDLSSLQFVVCGAAPMPADAIREFERRYRVPMIEGYGLSEGTVASAINPLHGKHKPGTVGLPFPGQEVAIASQDGRQLPQGEVGEVVIRGPNVMRGYLGKPEATAEALRHGWLQTGDLGYLDIDGYLVLVDRKKDMIIRGGENIYPNEIEAVLYQHPAVQEAAVVGRPDPVYGEQPVAYVLLRPGAHASPDELLEHCKPSLAKFKLPRGVYLMDNLPKNTIGKILKDPLRDDARSR